MAAPASRSDVQALIRSAHEVGHQPRLLEAVEAVNDRQKSALVRKIRHHFKDQLQGRTFALWGLAFKPNTDDMREAPSRVIIEALLQAGAKVRAYDPVALDEARRIFSGQAGLTLSKNAYEVADGADALVIATEWKEFLQPDFRPPQERPGRRRNLRWPQSLRPVHPGALRVYLLRHRARAGERRLGGFCYRKYVTERSTTA